MVSSLLALSGTLAQQHQHTSTIFGTKKYLKKNSYRKKMYKFDIEKIVCSGREKRIKHRNSPSKYLDFSLLTRDDGVGNRRE